MNILKLFFCLLLLFLWGCYPAQIDYELGWATQQISGVIEDEKGNPIQEPSFIVVRSFYSQFVQLEDNSPIYYPNAQLVFPDEDGYFYFPFDLDAAKISLSFVTSGYFMQQYFFKRQLGVGNLRFKIKMKKTPNWQDHLFISVTPFLQEFIIDQRYELTATHQLFLGNWIDQETQSNTPVFKNTNISK